MSERAGGAWGRAGSARFAWAIATSFVVESVVVGLAALPAVVFWRWHWTWGVSSEWLRIVLLTMSLLPAYVIFAASLMALSAAAMRLLGWRPPKSGELRIADLDWPLLDWARYGISTHVVRVLAGAPFRNTPLWTAYMRLNGARIGRHAWVNTLDTTDHCLLEFGDDVVIGAGAHLSGHTVERGVVRFAPVRLGAGTTIGVNAHVEIDVETGPGCQIGSLAMVPKGSRLEGDSLWVGCPVHRIDRAASSRPRAGAPT